MSNHWPCRWPPLRIPLTFSFCLPRYCADNLTWPQADTLNGNCMLELCRHSAIRWHQFSDSWHIFVYFVRNINRTGHFSHKMHVINVSSVSSRTRVELSRHWMEINEWMSLGLWSFYGSLLIKALTSMHSIRKLWPRRLTFTWWGCCGVCQRHKPTELDHSFLFCSCVYFCRCGPFNCIHSMNSPNISLSSHSDLLVLSLPYWSFQLYIPLWKSPSAL